MKMIIIAFGLQDNSSKCDFTDVKEDAWYSPYIAKAYNEQIITGYNDGTVGAQNPITREDFAVIIVRALKAVGRDVSVDASDNSFADGDEISQYAKEAVAILQNKGILNGTEDNLFLPKKSTTRAETAKVIAALIS